MSELDDMLARLVLMEKDVYANSDAVPVSFYTQEAPPYWTNTITGFTVELASQSLQIVTYQLTAQLVLATVTQGFEQEAERIAHAQLPVILLYFGQRRQFKRTNADAPVPFLDPRGAVITGGQVLSSIPSSGIGQTMFGLEINFEVPMWQETDQVIF